MRTPTTTVGLPLYRAGAIAWLALEGLCRQQHADPWELIVVEEPFHQPFGEARLKTYQPRLNAAGCKSVRYITWPAWTPLAAKWAHIAKQAHPHSHHLVLQGADDFSHPMRLRLTQDAMARGVDWYHEDVGLFYDRATGALAEYRHPVGTPKSTTALNMAVRLSLLHNLPHREKRRGTDRWMHAEATKRKGTPLREELHNHWHMGLFTSGWNVLSVNRSTKVANHQGHYHPTLRTVWDALPADVAERILAP
jgi:hypothetical protein